MKEDKNKITQQDSIRVDEKDPGEIEHLHQQFPALSYTDILEAIRKAGPHREDIIRYLKSARGRSL